MSVLFHCQHCGKKRRLHKSAAGRTIRCTCGECSEIAGVPGVGVPVHAGPVDLADMEELEYQAKVKWSAVGYAVFGFIGFGIVGCAAGDTLARYNGLAPVNSKAMPWILAALWGAIGTTVMFSIPIIYGRKRQWVLNTGLKLVLVFNLGLVLVHSGFFVASFSAESRPLAVFFIVSLLIVVISREAIRRLDN